MKKISNLKNLIQITIEYRNYLKQSGISFNEEGFPIFAEEMFLTDWPKLVIPYSQRKNWRVKNPQKTLICFFDSDCHLYPRLTKVLDEIDEYKKYMGVIGMDVTITDDMDEEWQAVIELVNQMFLAILAVNGVKIVINTRSATLDLARVFNNFPQQVMAASGFLGCNIIGDEKDFSYLEKILYLLPSKLVLYGKQDKIVEKQLDVMGIDYRVYLDFHRLCKEVPYVR